MLTSILLETKYVTTLWEISSSLRNFQTFKCHEKALSKPYQLHSSKLCLEIRYVKFFPTYFFRLKFILAARLEDFVQLLAVSRGSKWDEFKNYIIWHKKTENVAKNPFDEVICKNHKSD